MTTCPTNETTVTIRFDDNGQASDASFCESYAAFALRVYTEDGDRYLKYGNDYLKVERCIFEIPSNEVTATLKIFWENGNNPDVTVPVEDVPAPAISYTTPNGPTTLVFAAQADGHPGWNVRGGHNGFNLKVNVKQKN